MSTELADSRLDSRLKEWLAAQPKLSVAMRLRRRLGRFVDGARGIIHGLANVLRWAPVVWHDIEDEADPLLSMIEFKLRRLADSHQRFVDLGWGGQWPKDVKRMRACVELCRRIQEGGDYLDKEALGDLPKMAQRSAANQGLRDHRYLMQLLGKHMLGWWV